MNAAGVPEAFRTHKTKGVIALELLDRWRSPIAHIVEISGHHF